MKIKEHHQADEDIRAAREWYETRIKLRGCPPDTEAYPITWKDRVIANILAECVGRKK